MNVRGLVEWETRVERGESAVSAREELSEEATRREALYLGLRRLAGVSRAGFSRRFGAPPERWLGREIEELRGLELLADRAGRLHLTDRGILFSDEVFLRFVEALTPHPADS